MTRRVIAKIGDEDWIEPLVAEGAFTSGEAVAILPAAELAALDRVVAAARDYDALLFASGGRGHALQLAVAALDAVTHPKPAKEK